METVKNNFFQDHHTHPKYKLLKIISFKITTPTQIETVKNQFFQDYHILLNGKLLKISSFKITLTAPNGNC